MSKISNYDELLAERKNLEATLRSQKAYLNTQINTIREKFEPMSKIIGFLAGFKNNPGSSLLKMGSSVGIELLVRQKLAKASWLTKLILPFILKFTAAKTIDKVQEKITG